MKLYFFLAISVSSLLLAGPTMRLETGDGFFIEATLVDSSRLTGFTKNAQNCTGTYLKDMVAKRLSVIFDNECGTENISIYFSEQAYVAFYQGQEVNVEVEMAILPNKRKPATAKIIKK